MRITTKEVFVFLKPRFELGTSGSLHCDSTWSDKSI